MNVALGVLGALLLLATANSVIRTLVVPRVASSAISNMVAMGTLGVFRLVGRRFRSYPMRDRLLALAGPTTLLGLLVVWLGLFWLSYGLLMQTTEDMDIGTALRESGSSLFTLGYATNERAQLAALDFFAAATGPIIIGLMIGYLPTLYGSFNRREVEVTQLSWQAGEPNWGPELLARQVIYEMLDELPELWRTWAGWAADVSESHTTYSLLITIRSSRPKRNWALALLAVMDAAALQLALMPQLPQGRARIMLREGMQCLRSLNSALDVHVFAFRESVFEHQPSTQTVTLSRVEFDRGVQRLRAAGAPITVSDDAAWEVFIEWRSHYEAWAYQVCESVDAIPAWWSGERCPPTAAVPTPELKSIVAMGPAEARVRREPDSGSPRA